MESRCASGNGRWPRAEKDERGTAVTLLRQGRMSRPRPWARKASQIRIAGHRLFGCSGALLGTGTRITEGPRMASRPVAAIVVLSLWVTATIVDTPGVALGPSFFTL